VCRMAEHGPADLRDLMLTPSVDACNAPWSKFRTYLRTE
jgi:hypothetical protein